MGRLAAGGNEVGARGELVAVDGEGRGVLELGVAGDDLEPVDLGEVEVLVLAHPGDQLVLLCDQGGEVDRTGRRRHSREGMRAGGVARVGGGEQRLGRDTAHVHAGAAHCGLLDHHDVGVPAAGFDGRTKGGATGADDRHVVVHHPCSLLRSHRRPATYRALYWGRQPSSAREGQGA
jgi:hypothetical protein